MRPDPVSIGLGGTLDLEHACWECISMHIYARVNAHAQSFFPHVFAHMSVRMHLCLHICPENCPLTRPLLGFLGHMPRYMPRPISVRTFANMSGHLCNMATSVATHAIWPHAQWPPVQYGRQVRCSRSQTMRSPVQYGRPCNMAPCAMWLPMAILVMTISAVQCGPLTGKTFSLSDKRELLDMNGNEV